MSSAAQTEHQRAQELVLSRLAEIGGGRVAEDDLIFEGKKLILPEQMQGDPSQAIRIIQDFLHRDAQTVRFERTFRYRPLDGARALNRALYEVFGTTGRALRNFSFFGSSPPEMKTINVGPNETEQVPWGNIEFPAIAGTLYTGAELHREYGPLFQLVVDAPRRFRPHVEGLFKIVEAKLATDSIYKGKAIDGQEEPEFVDLSGVDPTKVVYSEEVETQLDAHVWSLIRYADKMREQGLPLKRAVLVHGPYGTGKTLAAFLTAQIAVQNGWTFLYCRPGKDDLEFTIQTARLYQRSVVFFEDVDTIADPTDADRDGVSKMLDVFDGIQAKGTEIVAVMTTNHPERIHRGMVRPGRLDAVIEIAGLDAQGVVKLIRANVRPEFLEDDLDGEAIIEAATDMEPAFIKEAIDRAQRYGMARNGGEPSVLGTGDFVHAVRGLIPQLEMMKGAKDIGERDSLGRALDRTVKSAFAGAVVHRDPVADNPWGRLEPAFPGTANGGEGH